MKKRREGDGKDEEKKAPMTVFYFSCDCSPYIFTSNNYEEVHGRAISHRLMFHTNRVYRPDSRLMLRGL